ncbi:MAG: tRNA pseudouridine(55) synthase TruB [Candidatus Sumerlaeia bacterium]|nr:tRNA pseudouridine(55) synthase TruB [Candidatus Sumerlaeia bacterium]
MPRRKPPRRPPEFNGFLNVDKPAGMTSHDVVDVVRRVANQQQVGHTGTLDPFATGVLVLALGKATKLAQYVTGSDKAYHGAVTLGSATTTYDGEGEVTSQGAIDHLDAEGIDAAMSLLRGKIQQVPPPYSAKKIAGKKLYEYARAGEVIVAEPKEVTVTLFVLDRWEPPHVHFHCLVSPGTYVRSLAHDLGQALGCGGHLSTLARTQVGRFRLEEAVALGDLERDADLLGDRLVPIPDAFPDIPSVMVGDEATRRLRNGAEASIEARGIGIEAMAATRLFALDARGQPVALVERLPSQPGQVRLQAKVQL